jgi:hypothetical protein
MKPQNNPEPECCPKFDPIPWDGVTFEWSEKQFIRDRVFTIFYMPVNFGKVITRLMNLVEKSGAKVPDYLCLSDHTSAWNMDVYLAVDQLIKGADHVTLGGRYYSKTYEGPFKDTGKWMKDFDGILQKQGLKSKKVYMWYTTCPKCAKKYGKNYVVAIAELW